MKNNNRDFLNLFLGIIVLIGVLGCGAPKNLLTFSEYEVQCVGVGSQGTQLIKVFCYGKKADMSDAIAEAKKNAVHAILFRGVAASSGCGGKSLSSLADLEKNKDFYTDFFKPNGQYLQYVNLSSDGSVSPNDRLKVGNRYKVGVVVSVAKDALRKDLEKAGVIKGLSSGF